MPVCISQGQTRCFTPPECLMALNGTGNTRSSSKIIGPQLHQASTHPSTDPVYMNRLSTKYPIPFCIQNEKAGSGEAQSSASAKMPLNTLCAMSCTCSSISCQRPQAHFPPYFSMKPLWNFLRRSMTSSVSFSCTRMVVRKWYVPSSCKTLPSQHPAAAGCLVRILSHTSSMHRKSIHRRLCSAQLW